MKRKTKRMQKFKKNPTKTAATRKGATTGKAKAKRATNVRSTPEYKAGFAAGVKSASRKTGKQENQAEI